MSSRRVRHRASLKSERLGNETLSILLGRPSHSLVRTLPPMPPLPLAASCAHLFIPELVLKRRPRQLPDACASHWQCDPNDCGLPVLGTDASTEAAAAAAAPTEATCARHRRHATVSSASLRSPRGGVAPVAEHSQRGQMDGRQTAARRLRGTAPGSLVGAAPPAAPSHDLSLSKLTMLLMRHL